MAIAAAITAIALAGASCTVRLCQPEVLDPWFAKLEQRQSMAGARPLHIIQIGDSHSAGDAITGALRATLQARHGHGGRGVLPPGKPYAGYVAQGAQAEMAGDWAIRAAFGPQSIAPRPPIGISGFTVTTLTEGAMMRLADTTGQGFDRFTVCALKAPGAGRVEMKLGDAGTRFDLAAPAPGAECRSLASFGAQPEARIVAQGGPVSIASWAAFRDQGGIALSNLGIVGAQLMHFGRSDETLIVEELRHYRPDLLILAFGTNEGFAPRLDPATYEAGLRAQVARLRRLAGTVPILLLGAPDALSRNEALRFNAPGEAVDCREDGDPRPLFAPPGLAAVRAVQRRVATELGLAFWDWHAAMGGDCAALRHARATPPLMRGDLVHFNSAGGNEIARLLDADLVAAMTARKGR